MTCVRWCSDEGQLGVAIGRRLRTRRLALGLTQKVVAARVGMSFQQLQKYEIGENRIPACRLMILARVLQIPPASLLDDSDGGAMPLTGAEVQWLDWLRTVDDAHRPLLAQLAMALARPPC